MKVKHTKNSSREFSCDRHVIIHSYKCVPLFTLTQFMQMKNAKNSSPFLGVLFFRLTCNETLIHKFFCLQKHNRND